MAEVYARTRPNLLRRIEILRSVAADLVAGQLDPAGRQTAGDEAHKLAGSLGVFGYPEGSRLARHAEQLLTGPATPGPDEGHVLAELVAAMTAVVHDRTKP
jgi:HPt (histidine-containing phosphotransfer) domain-containing protein